jgi:hypothetical protein
MKSRSEEAFMSQGHNLAELTIKVPGPFAGVANLGFSARYPEQSLFAPLRDVAIWIEGPSEPMSRLAHRLRMLAAAARSAYRWTDPVALTEEVMVMAFRDQSGGRLDPSAPQAYLDYFLNLVRPVVFPFLQDCAQVAHLRLSDRIDVQVRRQELDLAELSLYVEQIVTSNGDDLLVA